MNQAALIWVEQLNSVCVGKDVLVQYNLKVIFVVNLPLRQPRPALSAVQAAQHYSLALVEHL